MKKQIVTTPMVKGQTAKEAFPQVGERVRMSEQDTNAILRIIGFGAILIGRLDITRGRVLDKQPGDWHMWNMEGKRVTVSVGRDGIIASVDKIADPDLPEPL